VTIDKYLKLSKRGEKCDKDNECESGLVCVYSCGVPGCQNICDFPDEQPRP
jgi:hypothetical protein